MNQWKSDASDASLNRWKPVPKAPKSRGEQMFNAAVMYVVWILIITAIIEALDWLLHPFKVKSSGHYREGLEDRVERKQQNREDRYERISEDLKDPMVQFYLRKVDKPDEYVRDQNNAYYFDWFENWRRGKILDVSLRWAPPIFDENDTIQGNFLKYIRGQLTLIKNESWFKKNQFLSTINRYYPEFSAGSLRTFENDLIAYELEIRADDVEAELREEISGLKLPESLVTYLLSDEVEDRNTLKIATALKKAHEFGFDASTCIYLIEHKIDVTSTTADIIGKIVSEIGLPARIGHLYAQGKLDVKQLAGIKEELDSIEATFGTDTLTYSDGTEVVYDRLIDDKLKEYRIRNLK